MSQFTQNKDTSGLSLSGDATATCMTTLHAVARLVVTTDINTQMTTHHALGKAGMPGEQERRPQRR